MHDHLLTDREAQMIQFLLCFVKRCGLRGDTSPCNIVTDGCHNNVIHLHVVVGQDVRNYLSAARGGSGDDSKFIGPTKRLLAKYLEK